MWHPPPFNAWTFQVTSLPLTTEQKEERRWTYILLAAIGIQIIGCLASITFYEYNT